MTTTTVIDDDYVLNATNPTFSKKPVALTNSELTTTSRSLSYNTMRSYSPARYSTGRRTVSPSIGSEIRRSMSPSQLKRSLNMTADSSRSRSRHREFESYNNRLQRSRSPSPVLRRSRRSSPSRSDISGRFDRIYTSDVRSRDNSIEREFSDASVKEHLYRKTSDLATWSTDPVHLKYSTDPNNLRNSLRLSRRRSRSPSPSYRTRSRSPSLSYRARSRSVSPSYRGRSRSIYPVSRRLSRHSSRTELYENFPISSSESMAKDHFPVTMSAYQINHIEPPLSRSMTTSPPPKHLRPKPPHKWRVDGKIDPEIRALDLIDQKAKELDTISRMYNMTEMAPSIAASTVHMISPYATDLATLRLSRLKIEEDHLLEAKRLAEIERLRGPAQKWYEIKGPQFHTEARKNNELIKSSDSWTKLIDYR